VPSRQDAARAARQTRRRQREQEDPVAEPITIMGIYAHPADLATEGAGTMAIHADRGDTVIGIVLSDGIRMHPQFLLGEADRAPMTLPQYREFKREEVRRAANILGFASVEFMGWDENFFDANDERVLTLAKLVATHRPTVVVSHWPTGDYLVDSNKFAGIYVTRALGLSPTLVPEFDGIEPHYVKELFFFLMDQSIDTRGKIDPLGPIADFFVDITPVIGRKVQAFDQYVSQGYEGSMARKAAEARDGRFGMMANTSYAEAFMYSRSTTFRSLPLPEDVLNREFVPNDLPGDQITAWQTPSATAPEAYRR
jgi:LmbE family N-acetylglucosaminyl deacetylase